MENLKEEIGKCKTKKQVLTVLKKYGRHIERDDSDEVGCFSVWIDNLTRIYKNYRGEFIYQEWTPCKMNYSGIPVFFGSI